MTEPDLYLLVFAYLGARFAADVDRKRANRKTYAVLEKETGISKQNLIKLVQGKTIGIDILFRLRETTGGGSIEALVKMTQDWWDKLPPSERAGIAKRLAAQAKVRTSPKRGVLLDSRPKSKAEIDRIEKNVRTRVPSAPIGRAMRAKSLTSRKT